MRVFKAKYKSKNAGTKQTSKWYVEFRDHVERVQRIPGFTDRKQTEELGRKILDIYRQPNKSFSELLEMANDKSFDLLRDFTEACREEFETMRAQQF